MEIRLQKYIAENSELSRRKAEEYIASGKVQVNGKVVTEMGSKVTYQDNIIVEGIAIYKYEKVYYLLNKPIGVISSRSDDKGRLTVVDLVHENIKVFPIGRLDYNTSGIILLTNDGELSNGLMHPKQEVNKTYIAKVKGHLTVDDIKTMRKGVMIDGYMTSYARIKQTKYDRMKEIGTYEITIHEGRNQQVRKMFASVGGKVMTLKRTKYAFFDQAIEQMAPGEYRQLKPKEVKKLYHIINSEPGSEA